MYSRLVELMKERQITPYRLSKATGVTQATLSRWKNGKSSPSVDTLQTLADYFHVSLDYLSGNVNEPYFYLDNKRILDDINSYEENAPAPKSEDDELAELREHIRRNPELKILFSLSKNVTPAELKKAVKMIKTMWGDDDE